jgi:hypothetical protein
MYSNSRDCQEFRYCTVLRKKAEFRLATKGQHRFLGRLGAGNIFLGGAYGKQIPD